MNDKDKPSKAEPTSPLKKLTVEDLAQVLGGLPADDENYERPEKGAEYKREK